MHSTHLVQKLSGWLFCATTLVIALVPLVLAIALYGAANRSVDWTGLYTGATVIGARGVPTLILATLVAAVPLLPLLWVLLQMRGLFGNYRRGEVLTPESALCIRRIGLGLVVLPLVQLVSSTLRILVLTWDNPKGMRELSVSVSDDLVGLILVGGLMFVIGLAMHQAAVLAEENRGFV